MQGHQPRTRAACPKHISHAHPSARGLATAQGGLRGAACRAPLRDTRCAAVQEQVSVDDQLQACVSEWQGVTDVKERLERLVHLGQQLPPMSDAQKGAANRVMGCTSEVWVALTQADNGTVTIAADSDSAVTRGLAAVLVTAFSGLTAPQIDSVDPAFLQRLQLGPAIASTARNNAFRNLLESIQKRARALTGDLPRFPSLLVGPDSLEAQGAFAEAQAQYLTPRASEVSALAESLRAKRIGVVAHFYMDPEVQGVLTSAASSWPHIAISDSLVMADKAVAMAEGGCAAVCVLGVDFMSENVRAILDEAGHTGVHVFRMSPDAIGCSLAEAAETEEYARYLAAARAQPDSLHVIYINTSLRTKALANAAVPTITCTSSNVVQTVLQAFAQVPGGHVWYGPDTYMGRNLQQLFESLAECSEEEISALHPDHSRATVAALLPRLHHYQSGTCIVHEVFGGDTVGLVREGYSDAYITAHFEVPGEMFTLAMEAQRTRGMGVVGSTSNILSFITSKVEAAIERGFPERLQVVLGTEAGMITSIVRAVQRLLAAPGNPGVDVEIVFPVAPSAIATPDQATAPGGQPLEVPEGLSLVPGAAQGEGCSLEGGCAACPYMKMNSLAALMRVATAFGTDAGDAMLSAYKPSAYSEQIDGMSLAKAGCVPILHMRHFQQQSSLSDKLISDITSRH